MTTTLLVPPALPEPNRYIDFACRICAARGTFPAFTAREMMFGTLEVFEYVQCASCSCLQISRIPEDLSRHYPPNYYSHQHRQEPPATTGIRGSLVRLYWRQAAMHSNALSTLLLQRMIPKPTEFARYADHIIGSQLRNVDDRILDVGCGASPYRLAAYKRAGFKNVEGVDPFLAQDVNYFGVTVRKCTIEECEGEYAAVMFHHSLEHVPDPRMTLRSAARLLRSGGTCLVRLPIVETYMWRRFGVDWVELDAPRHLHLLAPESVVALAESSGFQVRATTFDSEPWELAVSRQYQMGVPQRGSKAKPTNSLFSDEELAEFARLTDQLNRSSCGGRACFYLQKIGHL